MSVKVCLSIVARKREIIVIAIALAVVAAVATSIIITGDIVKESPNIVSTLFKPRSKLTPSNCAECSTMCIAKVRAGKIQVSVHVIVTSKPKLLGVNKPKGGNATIGYILSYEYNIGKGGEITIFFNNQSYKMLVGGVHNTHSSIDTGVIVWTNRSICHGLKLKESLENERFFTRALSRQFSYLTKNWFIASLIVLSLGALIASYKGMIEIEKSTNTLMGEGEQPRCVIIGVSIIYGLAVFAGYAWGNIISNIAMSLLASYTGLYLPEPELIHSNLLFIGVFFTILVSIISIIVGESYARNKIYHNR